MTWWHYLVQQEVRDPVQFVECVVNKVFFQNSLVVHVATTRMEWMTNVTLDDGNTLLFLLKFM